MELKRSGRSLKRPSCQPPRHAVGSQSPRIAASPKIDLHAAVCGQIRTLHDGGFGRPLFKPILHPNYAVATPTFVAMERRYCLICACPTTAAVPIAMAPATDEAMPIPVTMNDIGTHYTLAMPAYRKRGGVDALLLSLARNLNRNNAAHIHMRTRRKEGDRTEPRHHAREGHPLWTVRTGSDSPIPLRWSRLLGTSGRGTERPPAKSQGNSKGMRASDKSTQATEGRWPMVPKEPGL